MDIHSHKCDCGHIWTHDRDEIAGQSDEVYDKAHTCTECGSIQKLRYYQPGSSTDTLMKLLEFIEELESA